MHTERKQDSTYRMCLDLQRKFEAAHQRKKLEKRLAAKAGREERDRVYGIKLSPPAQVAIVYLVLAGKIVADSGTVKQNFETIINEDKHSLSRGMHFFKFKCAGLGTRVAGRTVLDLVEGGFANNAGKYVTPSADAYEFFNQVNFSQLLKRVSGTPSFKAHMLSQFNLKKVLEASARKQNG